MCGRVARSASFPNPWRARFQNLFPTSILPPNPWAPPRSATIRRRQTCNSNSAYGPHPYMATSAAERKRIALE